MAAINLLEQLFITVDAIGIEKTAEVLRKAQFEEIKFDNQNVERIVKGVAQQFDIPVHEIILGSGRKNDRKYAIGFCAFYLFTIYKYKMEGEVDKFLKKHFTLCNKYYRLITKLNPNHISDKQYIGIKSKLDAIFCFSN